MWRKEVTDSYLPIFSARGKVFSVRAEAHAADVQIAIFVCFVIYEDAIHLRGGVNRKVLLKSGGTHHVFAPVFASKIWAARLQPVARYFPSAENLTQHTTLLPHDANVSGTERYEENRLFIPLVMKCVHKIYVKRTFDLGVKNGEPVTTFFFELRRNAKRVEFIQEAAVLAYRSERSRIVCGRV